MPELRVLTFSRGRTRAQPRVLSTKLAPPRLRRAVVPRPRLYRLLDAGSGSTLTVVGAPAGFGKTTLLAQWQAASARPVAWLSLDGGDADPFRLWVHVAAALERALPQLAPVVAGCPRLEPLIAGLLDGLTDAGPAVLVLDGFDRLGPGAADGTLRWFVANAPPALQVVVAGRQKPGFPLGLLRARGELAEVGAEDLRLTAVEALALAAPLVPDPAEQAELLARMDGWPAGVALELQARIDGRGLPTAAEYLLAEVLAGEPADRRDFLLRTSVLDRLTGPACDAVAGRSGSEALLRSLAQDSAFVFRDERRDDYRVHQAFAAALRSELGRREPELARDLHRRAARWHRAAGEDDQVIAHALAAGAFGEAGAAILAQLPSALDDGTHVRIATLIERLPPERVARPRIALAYAWLLALDGRRDEAELALAASRARLSPARAAVLERSAGLLRAVFAWDGAVAIQPAGTPLGSFAAGRAAWWSGELDKAAAALELAAGAPRAPKVLVVAARATQALVALEQGDVAAAARAVDAARATAEEHDLRTARALGVLATAEGAVLAARGNLAAALPPAWEGLSRRRACGELVGVVEAICVAAPIVTAGVGRAEAADLLHEGRATLAACPFPGVLPERLARAQRVALPRPDRAPAGSDLSDRELEVLRLLAEGLPKRDIACRLHLSFNTIHSHTKAIYRKLGAAGRGDAVACATVGGLLGVPHPGDRPVV